MNPHHLHRERAPFSGATHFAGRKAHVLLAIVAAISGCWSRPTRKNACTASEFAAPAEFVDLFRDITTPGGAFCGIVVHGWREPEHSVYLIRDAAKFRAVVRVHGLSSEQTHHEAPLDDNVGAMLERICKAVIATHAQCRHGGRDGTYYLMQVSTDGQAQRTALTWSPKPGTDSDLVVTMFLALRAYVAAPPDLRVSAYSTFYEEAYQAYNALEAQDAFNAVDNNAER